MNDSLRMLLHCIAEIEKKGGIDTSFKNRDL